MPELVFNQIIGDKIERTRKLRRTLPLIEEPSSCERLAHLLRGEQVLYFETPDLEFRSQFRIPPGVNWWQGAEWHGRSPAWWCTSLVRGRDENSLRRLSNQNRAELWVLRGRSKLLVADTQGNIRLLEFRSGRLRLSPFVPLRAVEYLEREADRLSRSHKGLTWVRKTLEALKAAYDDIDVSSELAKVDRLIAELR